MLLLLAALIALLIFIIRRRRRQRNVVTSYRSPPLPTILTPPIAHFEEWIQALQRRHLTARSYRAGCHELAEMTRRRWSRGKLSRTENMTAREALRELGDTPLSRFLLSLATLRFRRSEPEATELQDICDRAITTDRAVSGGLGT